jgi:hypothetical protein
MTNSYGLESPLPFSTPRGMNFKNRGEDYVENYTGSTPV